MLKENLAAIVQKELGAEVKLIDGGKFADLAITPGDVAAFRSSYSSIEDLVASLREAIPEDLVEAIKFEAGFINFTFAKDALFAEADEILQDLKAYQRAVPGTKVVFDYSGPNIAKPFSVGHLRSTVIGQANLNIHQALGYETVGINHIGDWGTQFGKLIYAILHWGDEQEIIKDPIKNLNFLYVKFHEEAQKNSQIEDEAREWSKKLEDGDEQARAIWQKCIKWSFAEFDRIYKILGIEIENVIGESFYEDKVQGVIEDLKAKNLLEESEGAMVVKLDDLPPALIERKDGATLYMTRDLAAIKYRVATYNPQQLIYHVGLDQQLHFKQLEKVAKKLGYLNKTELIFAGHGMMRLPEGKMSTRRGRVILLEDLIQEAQERVEKMLAEKGSEAKEDALPLAISAIKYADLSSNRRTDVVFSFDKMIDLKGNSSVYLQYVYARLNSLVTEFEKRNPDAKALSDFAPESTDLIREVIKYKGMLMRSADKSEPSILTDFIYSLANKFNAYYEKNRIITDTPKDAQNIKIIYLLRLVIGEGLDLLGITKFSRL